MRWARNINLGRLSQDHIESQQKSSGGEKAAAVKLTLLMAFTSTFHPISSERVSFLNHLADTLSQTRATYRYISLVLSNAGSWAKGLAYRLIPPPPPPGPFGPTTG